MKDKETENEFIKEYGEKKIWMNWRLEERSIQEGGEKRRTKVPYRYDGSYGSSTDPNTWTTYSVVDKARPNFLGDLHYKEGVAPILAGGVGVVFEAENIVAVDLDHVIAYGPDGDPILDVAIQPFVETASTYMEKSPSGTGIHAFFKLDERYVPILNRTPKEYKLRGEPEVEIYASGRYFTFTGDTICNVPVCSVTTEELEEILALLGYPWGGRKDASQGETASLTPISTGASVADYDDLLEKMFASKNGIAIRALWDGDLSEYTGDHSSADLGLCSHLAFWFGRDATLIEKAWMSSPLGAREKTQKRPNYRERTIDKAIKGCREVYEGSKSHCEAGAPVVNDDEVERVLATLQSKPGVKGRLIYDNNEENIIRIFKEDLYLKDRFRYNSFSYMTEALNERGVWEDLCKAFIINAQVYIQRTYYPHFANVSYAKVEASVVAYARHNQVNPVRDYFTSFEWDRSPRLDSWMYKTYGTPDDPLHQAIGANWIKGLIKRVVRPGCKFDEVLVLEGPQGWKKTTSLAVLGGEWHVESTARVDGAAAKDFAMLLAHNVIVELAEGETLNRTEVREMKATITKTEDQVRLPYESGWSRMKRHCVFAMTTNDTEYLKDDSGNRRFLPVKLEHPADLDWLKENREQILAEAYFRAIKDGETTWEYPEELTDLQESRMDSEGHEEELISWYADFARNIEDGVTVLQVYQAVWLGNAPLGRDMPGYMNRKIGGMLRRILFLEKKQVQIGGVRNNRWYPTTKTLKLISKASLFSKDDFVTNEAVEAEGVDD